MRTIPAALQTKLETDLGVELVVVLQIFWGGTTTGPSTYYADRTIAGTPVQGKILELASFDEAVQVSGGGQSASFSVTLDDTDGTIKAMFDAYDIHKAPVKAWLYAIGTTFATDKAEIFLGQINSPVIWSEGARTFSLSVVNRIEDVEVGFSAEEGEFPSLPEDLIGKPWPLVFGTVRNMPALRAVPAISGTLARGVGISDFTLPSRIALAEAITCPQTPIGFKCVTSGVGAGSYNATCNIAFETDQACLQARCVEIERLTLQMEEQQAYEYPQITIFGGKQFPQGRTITLNINGGLFTGHFTGTPTNPTNVFAISSRRHPRYDPTTGTVIEDEVAAEIKSRCPSAATDSQDSDYTDTAFGPVWTGARQSRISWENYRNALSADFFWAGGGSTVTMQNNNEIVYIANIVPSTILRVAAWRTINGNQFLLTVPSQFYTVRQVDYNGYDVMEIVFDRPLSNEQQDTGGGWSDEIFITQTSTVGPNTVDIIRWFIETYTSYSIDSTSFDAVETALTAYPMHFALLRRPNILTILQELAQRARCALWQKGDTFYIKYLSEEPTPAATITEDDVLRDNDNVNSLQISLTKTEDLVTKLTTRWNDDLAYPEKTLILRHNMKKYGTHAREEDYYPYAHLDLVRKSATFWLVRWANTWKKVRCLVSMEFLKLEPFDAVTVDLPDVAPAPFVAVVERATLNTTDNEIELELWCPIRAGESEPYLFAFPAAISEQSLFPTIEARNASQAGSGNEPNFSTMAPPGHPLEVTDPGVVGGFSLGCNGEGVTSLEPGRCRQDHGDGKPSDIGDTAPDVDTTSDTTGNVSGGTSPVTNGAGYGFWSQWMYNSDWNKKTESDAGKGRENTYRNSNSIGNDNDTTSGPVDNDYLHNLPDPDDVQGCSVQVRVFGFQTEDRDTRHICTPATSNFEEVYAFDSMAAAQSFCEGMKGASNCGHNPPCGNCVNCIVRALVCPEGATEGDGNLVGYRGDPDYPNTSFMAGPS